MSPFVNINLRRLSSSLLVSLLLLGPCSVSSRADGGQLRLVERHGDLQISVFSSPNPLRAGPIDISVLVQDTRTGQPIDDAAIHVRLVRSDRTGTPIIAAATAAAATNKLLRAAVVELPVAGSWKVEVTCTASGNRAAIQFETDVARRLPEVYSAWIWFTWPLGAVLVFGIHRALVARRKRCGTRI